MSTTTHTSTTKGKASEIRVSDALVALAIVLALVALWRGCDAASSQEVAALDGRVTLVEGDVNGVLVPAVAQSQGDIAALQAEVSAVRGDVTTLEVRVARNERELSRVRRQLRGVRQEVERMSLPSEDEEVETVPTPPTEGARMTVTRTTRVTPGS